MAALHAKHKHQLNAAASGFSSIGLLNSFAGLAGNIFAKQLGRTGTGLIGLFGNLIAEGGKIISDTAEGCIKKNAHDDRRKYARDYLNTEAQRIKDEARDGTPQVQGVIITLNDAKRIALKKLGMYTGAVVTGAPFRIDEKQLDLLYNALALERADSLANGNSQEKDQMLDDLGLDRHATRDEIAAMLGYQS